MWRVLSNNKYLAMYLSGGALTFFLYKRGIFDQYQPLSKTQDEMMQGKFDSVGIGLRTVIATYKAAPQGQGQGASMWPFSFDYCISDFGNLSSPEQL